MTRPVVDRVTRFRGLNDRRHLPSLASGESPDLINVEFSRRAVEKRLGYERLHTYPLRNGSIRLDGVNDHLRIANHSGNAPIDGGGYFGIGVVLRSRPSSAKTLVSCGFGAAADLYFDIRYDSTAGTGSLGAWIVRVRDTVGPATITYTLDDGDGVLSPVGQYRFIQWYQDGASVSTAELWSDTALLTSSAQSLIDIANWNVTQDFFVGVGTTALNTVGTDFIDASVCEFRYSVGAAASLTNLIATTSNLFYVRELTDAARALCTGYWKMNDGDDSGVCADLSGTSPQNDAVIVNNPAPWVLPTDNALVLGDAAVRFRQNGQHWLDVRDVTTTPTTVNTVFAASGGALADWTVRCIVIPILPPGATTHPDGVVFWAGASATLPAPVAIRVVSDRFVVTYNDNGTARTITMSGAVSGGTAPTVTALNGKRVRLNVYMPPGAATALFFQVIVDNGAGGSPAWTTYTLASTFVPSTSGPTTISQDWAFGRHVTNFATARLGDQTAFHTDGTFAGIIDDIQILDGQQAFSGVVFNPNGLNPFIEASAWPNYPGLGIALYLRLNEGSGNGLLEATGFGTGTNAGWQPYLRPEQDDGARWDVGLVDQYIPVKGSLLFAYDRFLSDGTKKRSLLAASGTTLYDYNEDDGPRVAGALPARAEACTAAQYGRKVIIAGPNGRRPVIFDGDLRNAGIKAPTAAAVVAVSNGAGTFINGQHYLYVTYRNRNADTPIESNPSPGVLVTFSGANDTVDSVQVPTSPDPQVNQRRIWMTASAVTAVDGSVAYLVATIDDNSTTNYTTDITSLSLSAEQLEYTDHAAPPDATTVGQFLDYTLLGGSQTKPTRLYYSFVGTPDYFDPSTGGRYLDLDLDSGDPILAIAPLLDRAIVDVGDGKWGIFATGNADRPLDKTRVNDTHGAVGPQASLVINNQQFYIGESDFYVSDGYRETNLTSPDEVPVTAPVYTQLLGRTSIQTLLRDKMDWSGRHRFVVMEHRARNQIWFGVRMTDAPSWLDDTNTHLIAYDTVQGLYSRYDIPLDCGTLAEISSEKAEPVGIVQGFIVQFDQATGDGAAATAVLTVTSKTNTSTDLLLGFGGTPFAAFDPRYLRCFIYKIGTHTVVEKRIVSKPSSASILLDEGDSGVAVGDRVIVAAAPYFIDLVPQLGDPLATKRLLGGSFNLERIDADSVMRVQWKGDVRTLPTTLSGFSKTDLSITSSIISRWLAFGGLGTTFYVRVGEIGYSAGTSTQLFPGGQAFRLYGIAFEGHEVSSRSRS